MIIDSHAHYSHARYDSEFPYLKAERDGYSICRNNREGMFDEFKKHDIVGVIEPTIGFEDIEKQLEVIEKKRDLMWVALGVHPTRCYKTSRKNKKKLSEIAAKTDIIAIGETGLDYHYPRMKQHRLCQKEWFVYQIKLADKLGLPLVLHIRDANHDAIKILKKYKSLLHGGVVHCFNSDHETAKEYIDLGFTLGIGGYLLGYDGKNSALDDAVKQAPLSSLLVETDAPFVLPDFGEIESSKKQLKKLCNSSLIIPKVIEKIARLKSESYETVEDAIYQNTVRTFDLKI